MKPTYLALLFLASIVLLAAPATARPHAITGILANNTVMFDDGSTMALPVYTPTVKNTTNALKYPVPTWMPKPFDGTPKTCKMGNIGTNWRGDKVCYRRR